MNFVINMNKLRAANERAMSLAESMGIRLGVDGSGNVFLGGGDIYGFVIKGPLRVTKVLELLREDIEGAKATSQPS